MSTVHFAQHTDFAFVDDLLEFGEDYDPQPGDVVEFEANELKTTSGEPFPGQNATVVSHDGETMVLRDPQSGNQHQVETDGWFYVTESPAILSTFEEHLRRATPDGVAFADGLVEPGLIARLRQDVQQLIDREPVDYHPGSGTKVRDLVHPSLFPYIKGRSVLLNSASASSDEDPDYDRFGRTYESSRYQWLPTPFRVDASGAVSIASYINNLDQARHGRTYEDLAALFTTALPLIESVVGYVDSSKFWQEECAGIEHEAELPEHSSGSGQAAPPTSLRGRELLVIPKLVEYQLGAGETHEGVWHVEGMSHEHIVATCVYILHRDAALQGGELRFKRAYTVQEAGRLFWGADQGRPRPVDRLVDEGTVPLGSLATPEGRLLVFPNSHIHKLSALSVAAGASCARRQVIVFWLVDPQVKIPSTHDVAPQQALIPREEALAVRLELMEERKRHKQSLNVRAVSLCEH